jgi:beta-ribofuranosylaminobenzene 5'-phosphate synthase
VTPSPTILVEAPARLHLGLLDMRGDLGRRFGGLGAALRSPSLLLEARRAAALEAEGAESERLLQFARLFFERQGLQGGARLRLLRSIPAHAGLGSGTQLALATARALATLYSLDLDAPALAAATDRARRSAIGTWAFAQGGFLLEGGRTLHGSGAAPLLLRRPMPADWCCVIAISELPRGLSGAAEEEAFQELPPASEEIAGRIARIVLTVVLPALVEEDLTAFGRGITELQRLVGETFRTIQGGRFAHAGVEALVDLLLHEGAAGAGQSSWGPAAFGLVRGEEAAGRLAARARDHLGGHGTVIVTAFDNRGARCWTPSS